MLSPSPPIVLEIRTRTRRFVGEILRSLYLYIDAHAPQDASSAALGVDVSTAPPCQFIFCRLFPKEKP